MKKALSTLLLFALALCVLASCGGNGGKDEFVPDFTTPATGSEYFVYSGSEITGLTEAGKAQKALTAPADATGIAANALAESTALEAFVIGSRSGAFNLANGCFGGTKNLKLYIGASVDKVTCGGKDLFKDATGAKIFVVAAQYANFKEDYTWGNYSDQMEKYE